MITQPRRSVTRFFIPLIDVLILLFCIFLLMPFVSAPAQPEPEAAAKDLPADTQTLQKQVAELRQQLTDVTTDRDSVARQLDRFEKNRLVRVFHVDQDSGDLYYFVKDSSGVPQKRWLPDRDQPIRGNPDESVQAWAERERVGAGGQELYFLILNPQQVGTVRPSDGDLARYRRWFEKVKYGFDSQ